ncbi:hypothetical protein [Ruegeria sp. A3M17]|uniref:hypothetical protein n=1 Tax=Ruegeria sp. A3M17 TaxID=2267229 RepID=UPI0011BD895F|nr:hypothetical protein [Ruegeria sp. A3M17]
MALMLLAQPNLGSARDYPTLVGDTIHQECQTAKEIADWAYRSTLPDIMWPDFAPADSNAQIVLSRLNDFDDRSGPLISGGYTMYDPGFFERKEPEENPRKYDEYYWQREPQNGKRLVIWSSNHSWRGNWFYLYYLEQDQSFEEFYETLWLSPRGEINVPSLLEKDQWDAPTVLKRATVAGASLWVINQRKQHAKWGIWDVLIPVAEEMVQPCWIDFTPNLPTGLDALPTAVKRFAKLADEALGPGTGEGTLAPTSRIRAGVARKWTLISERPWALTRSLYNTRKEVEGGLEVWARQMPARAIVYRKLKREYDKAVPQLADFLRTRFEIDPGQADKYSAFAMDYMLRSYFVFHSPNGARTSTFTNPWPEAIR